MGDFDPTFVRALAQQSWSFYAVGMFLIMLRIYARIQRLGLKGLQNDDFLTILAGCIYTILIVSLNVIAGGGGSNLYDPDDFPTFSQEDIQDRIKGSKIVILSEQAMLNVIYSIKVCMLIMYTRLTLGHKAQRLVRYLAIYVAVGWCATEVAFFTACTPFNGYWAMPPPDPQCATLEYYSIVQGCFNISSDALMLCIPLPLITRLSMPLKQKAVLFVIFSMGIFVIIAALLTKIFNLTDINDPSYMLWYTREASVAVYVSNLPMIWPLLREYFPKLRMLTPGQKSSITPPGASTSARPRIKNSAGARALPDGFGNNRPMANIQETIKGGSCEELNSIDTELGVVSQHKSCDNQHTDRAMALTFDDWGKGSKKGGIHKVTTVHVQVHVPEAHVHDTGDESDDQNARSIYQAHDIEKGKDWGI